MRKYDANDSAYSIDKREQWEFLVRVWYYLAYVNKEPLIVPESDPIYLVKKEACISYITTLFSKYLDNCISI